MQENIAHQSSLALVKSLTRSDEEKYRVRHAINQASYNLPKIPLGIYRKIQLKLKNIDRERVLDLEKLSAADLQVRVSKEEISEVMGDSFRTNNLSRACKTITSEPMYFNIGYNDDGEIREAEVFSNLVSLIKIDNDGIIAEFTPTQVQFYCYGYFTEYREELTHSFETTYTYRIFDLLMKFHKTGKVNKNNWRVWTLTVPFSELHWTLRAPNSYKRFANFKAYVLDNVEKEINALDEFDLEWSVERHKRKVKNIIFVVKQKMIGTVKDIEPPVNDKTMQWLEEYFKPTKSQRKLAWEWYVASGKTEKLYEIYKYCKNREAKSDKEPIVLIKYFWHMVDTYKDKPFDF